MSKTEKKKWWNFYSQWRKEKCYCPALKENVIISLLGWYHLTGQNGAKKRPWNDVSRRMQLLQFAREIILESTTVQNIEKRKDTTYFVLEAMKIVTEKGNKEWRKVRVILFENRKGQKTFLSVMDKKSPTKRDKSV